MSVVDHLRFAAAAEILRGLRKKHLAVEALEGRVELEKQHVRVTQNLRSRLRGAQLPGHFDLMWRGVVLGFFSRLEGVLPCRQYGLLSDPVPTTERCQSRIGNGGTQLLMDSDQVPLAGGIQIQDLLPIRLCLLRTKDGRRDD